MSASLEGTMQTPPDPDAIAAEQAQQLAANTAQAQQAAGQAQQQYAQAAQTPPPGISPQDQFLSTLLSGVAGTLQQSNAPQQRAQQALQAKQKALADAREQNLAQLHDVFVQRAETARQAGDLEAESKARMQAEKYAGMLQEQHQATQNTFAAQENEKQRQNRLAIANVKQQGEDQHATTAAAAKTGTQTQEGTIRKSYNTADNGGQYIDMSRYKGKDFGTARDQALNEGVTPITNQKDISTLQDLKAIRTNNQKIVDTFASKLAPTPGQRPKYTVQNSIASILQTDSAIANYKTWDESVIRTARTLSGTGGRMSKEQFKLLLNARPKLSDSYGKFKNYFDIINSQIGSLEDSIVPPSKAQTPGMSGVGAAPGGGKVENWVKGPNGYVRQP